MTTRRNRITGTITYGNNVERNDDWTRSSNPWTVELRYQRRKMTVPFWTGSALGEPSLADVLQCLALDATDYDGCRSFEDWCGDYGYDSDSRKAEATWRQVESQTRKLRVLLGRDYR